GPLRRLRTRDALLPTRRSADDAVVAETLTADDAVDVSFIAGLLLRGPLCLDCLALKTVTPADRIEAVMRHVAQEIALTSGQGFCAICGKPKVVHRLR